MKGFEEFRPFWKYLVPALIFSTVLQFSLGSVPFGLHSPHGFAYADALAASTSAGLVPAPKPPAPIPPPPKPSPPAKDQKPLPVVPDKPTQVGKSSNTDPKSNVSDTKSSAPAPAIPASVMTPVDLPAGVESALQTPSGLFNLAGIINLNGINSSRLSNANLANNATTSQPKRKDTSNGNETKTAAPNASAQSQTAKPNTAVEEAPVFGAPEESEPPVTPQSK